MNPLRFTCIALLPLAAIVGEAAQAKKFIPPPVAQVIAVSRDGKTLAIATAKGDVRLWDIAKAKEQSTFHVGHSTNEAINAMAFSPDDKTLAIAGLKGRMEIWDVATGKRVVNCVGHGISVARIQFSPDGKTLYSGGNDGTQREAIGNIRVWDAETGKEKALLKGHRGAINGLSLSADGKVLASACFMGDIKIWNTETLKDINATANNGPVRIIYSAAISPDGKRLLTGGQNTKVTVWDVASLLPVGEFEGHKATIARVAFSPDGKLAVSEDTLQRISIWDPKTFREFDQFPFAGVFGCAITPDSKMLIGCSKKDGAVQTWDLVKLTSKAP